MISKRPSLKKVIVVFGLLVVFIIGGCSINEEKDILFVRDNLEDFKAETIPYKKKIKFTLKTDEVVHGIDEPIKIASIYDTDVFVTEVKDRDNGFFVVIGFDGHFKQDGGTMLSTFSLEDNGRHRTGSVKFKAYDDNGELGDYGGGTGDNKGQYQQRIHYRFEKKEFMQSNKWTFEISGLHLLKHDEK